MAAPLAMAAVSTALELGKKAFGAVSGGPNAAPDKAKSTAQDFETMFLENALQRLTESAGTDGPLGENGPGGGVGIADQVYRELMRMQEAHHAG